ncbi:hypothetical protein [Kribbella catacumbae]|nr:hypothetical protein [Kribbella catacumbae]
MGKRWEPATGDVAVMPHALTNRGSAKWRMGHIRDAMEDLQQGL